MLAIAAIAVNLHQAMGGRGGPIGFAAGYVVLQSLLIGLYLRARRHVAGQGRKLTETYIVGYSATIGIWLGSIFVPAPFRYALWSVANHRPRDPHAGMGRAQTALRRRLAPHPALRHVLHHCAWRIPGSGGGGGNRVRVHSGDRVLGVFALSLATLHIGAEWTSMRDRTFLGRLGLAAFTLALAAAGDGYDPCGSLPPMPLRSSVSYSSRRSPFEQERRPSSIPCPQKLATLRGPKPKPNCRHTPIATRSSRPSRPKCRSKTHPLDRHISLRTTAYIEIV